MVWLVLWSLIGLQAGNHSGHTTAPYVSLPCLLPPSEACSPDLTLDEGKEVEDPLDRRGSSAAALLHICLRFHYPEPLCPRTHWMLNLMLPLASLMSWRSFRILNQVVGTPGDCAAVV